MCVLTKDGATKMVCRGVWGILSISGVRGGVWCKWGKMRGTPTWDNTYQ